MSTWIGRRPTPECRQCSDVRCAAARCHLCGEEADIPQHVLLRFPTLACRRLRYLVTTNSGPTIAQDDHIFEPN